MRFRFKARTSTDVPWINLAKLDLIWGLVAPILALWLRDKSLLGGDHFLDTLAYIGVSAVVTALCFIYFRLSHSVSRYFSVSDAIMVVQASAAAVIGTLFFCFVLTRLDNIPRSVPLAHFMILAVGNITGRAERYLRRRRRNRVQLPGAEPENIIIVGVSDLAWFYIQMVEDIGADIYQIVALVDDRRALQGRFVHGYPVAGAIKNVSQVVDEYSLHGVTIHRLVLSIETAELEPDVLEHLFKDSKARGISVEVLPDRLGLVRRRQSTVEEIETPSVPWTTDRPFWTLKRVFDVVAAAILVCLTAPLGAVIFLLVLLDCGMPVVFWQVRMGHQSRKITIYKFRTLRAPFRSDGQPIPDDRRISRFGYLLRRTHLDELPQLLSVLVGDMSMIGPRPLLPIDLVGGASRRSAVRPGITGWAQVNGGTLLTPKEKEAMDEWYIRHASLRVELLIFIDTIRTLFFPIKRNEDAIRVALYEQETTNSAG